MKVSILSIAYNHEKYISDAIDSMLMQKTKFNYEIVIGEDCSEDNTRKYILDYQARYPDKIRIITSDNNVGMSQNLARTMNSCIGEYVAILEGDDYWIDPYKLQKQVDFLDANQDCSLCFSAYNKYAERTGILSEPCFPPHRKETYSLEDLLAENMIGTLTMMYRNKNIPEYPEWLHKMPAIDYGLHVINAQHGKLGYIDEVMATYRCHDGGVWSALDKISMYKKQITLYSVLKDYLGPNYNDYIYPNIYKYSYLLMNNCVETNNLLLARQYAKMCIKHNINKKMRETAELYLRPYVPLFWNLMSNVYRLIR